MVTFHAEVTNVQLSKFFCLHHIIGILARGDISMISVTKTVSLLERRLKVAWLQSVDSVKKYSNQCMIIILFMNISNKEVGWN